MPALPARCDDHRRDADDLREHARPPEATLNAYRATAAWNAADRHVEHRPPGIHRDPGADRVARRSSGLQQWNVTTLTRQLYTGPDYGFLVKDSVDDAATGALPDLGQHGDRHAANRPTARPHLGLTRPADGVSSTTICSRCTCSVTRLLALHDLGAQPHPLDRHDLDGHDRPLGVQDDLVGQARRTASADAGTRPAPRLSDSPPRRRRRRRAPPRPGSPRAGSAR